MEAPLMPEKSPKRLRLEASLAEDPADQFLRYGLALQCLREGDRVEGRERLLALIADHPEESVAAYQQLGQSYMESGEIESARETLKTGILKANARKDWHAAGEMEGFLGQLA
jgi:thioredoxin-like negative regulator of GroEL